MIVIDASAMVELLLCTDLGGMVKGRLASGAPRHAPHLLDTEVAQVLRRFVRQKSIAADRARLAIEDLRAFPLRRHGHVVLLERIFELRDRLTAYDAAYLALAEALDATLVTCDAAFARTPEAGTRIELIASA
ncbi:MAG: type II toxin-antitoxin system VapC family toxin [Planctomycetes bacterium]|nr:type II toxin-antitoxin system VapC family toxin [Planctomycetota bacterium]